MAQVVWSQYVKRDRKYRGFFVGWEHVAGHKYTGVLSIHGNPLVRGPVAANYSLAIRNVTKEASIQLAIEAARREGFQSVDGIPWELHQLEDPVARSAAVQAFLKAR